MMEFQKNKIMKNIKIGVISDTHREDRGRNKALWQKIQDCFVDSDIIIHAGDHVNTSVVYELESIAKVEAVCGNMDSWDVSRLYPEKKVLTVKDDIKIGIIHGYGPPWDFPEKLFSFL